MTAPAKTDPRRATQWDVDNPPLWLEFYGSGEAPQTESEYLLYGMHLSEGYWFIPLGYVPNAEPKVQTVAEAIEQYNTETKS